MPGKWNQRKQKATNKGEEIHWYNIEQYYLTIEEIKAVWEQKLLTRLSNTIREDVEQQPSLDKTDRDGFECGFLKKCRITKMIWKKVLWIW